MTETLQDALVPRFFQFSTQSSRSLPNAALALDVVRPLTPLEAELSAVGVPLDDRGRGHCWAFSPRSLIARPDDVLVPGDLGLRIDPGLMLSRVYEVVAFFPDSADLPEKVNRAPWRSAGKPYPNAVVFKPYVDVDPRPFRQFVDRHVVGRYVSGPRYEARFLRMDVDAALRDLGSGRLTGGRGHHRVGT